MKSLILSKSIALLAVFATAALATPASYVPQPAYGDDVLNPADVADFGASDTNRIQGNIARCLARKAPFVDILEGGTIKAGVSQTQRSIVQERAVLNQSLTRPEFVADKDMCGQVGEAADVGSTEYTYFLATNRGMGPLVCVKQMRDDFASSYEQAENSLKKQIVQLVNSDVRATLVDRSGCKLVVKAGETFLRMFDGDAQRLDTPFTTAVGLPDAPINFKLLEYLSIFLRENLLVEGFEGTVGEPLLRFIGSQEIISRLRDEAGIVSNHQSIAAGSFTVGKDQLTKYTWEGPYRGYAFGIDPQPLRFNSVDNDGQPNFIPPEVAVPTSNGVAARVNPLWARARFEIALVIGAESFRRLAPEQYTGEGSFKFPAQITTGDLMWQIIKDNGNNAWGDYGRHFYQISRAYKPERPHAVTAIAFKRSQTDFGLTSVATPSDYSSSDSL